MIGVYVIYEDNVYRLDLFNDEQISITSSQQDINDISKVFTDYSQNFSIPANANNNKVFKYWYENALDNGFDDSQKLDCFIELNGNTFRTGKLKLEKATIENGVAKDYAVSFFGNLTSLKDQFKDDKLINVTEINSIIDFQYTSANVVGLVTTNNNSDIAFPLITGNRVWTYGDDEPTDISTLAGSIEYKELFPAVRVSKMFEAIGQRYGINFVGDFLSEKRFTELFLYCKNSETIKVESGYSVAQFSSITGSDRGYFDATLYNNQITYYGSIDSDDIMRKMDISVSAPVGTKFNVKIFKDGTLINTITGLDSLVYNVFTDYFISSENAGVYSFEVASSDIGNTTFQISTYASNLSYTDTLLIGTQYVANEGMNLAGLMPDISVSNFFSGILQMFNLTCYSEDGVTFFVEPLVDWYANGAIVDITRFCEPNWEVNKSKQYKSLTFKYEKSESILNNQFFQIFQREFGDYTFAPANQDKNGEEYKVELPFENLIQQKFTDTALQVGFTLNKDLKPYTPKPIVMYKFGLVDNDCDFYIEDTLYSSYNAFGQDLVDGEVYSINFNVEQSTMVLGAVLNTLYAVYYNEYIEGTFFLKSRQLNVSGVFNLNTLVTLKLNDKVIIRDKRYRINRLQTNLNNQTFQLELITDL